MSTVVELVGDALVDKDGQTINVSDLLGQIGPDGFIGLYFSAHWCPPCRGFTPELADFYKKFRETEKGKQMDIIFVSSDEDDDSFKEYLNEMPWKALPYADRERKAKLSKRFKVQGIPTLIFIEASTGKVVTTRGREALDTDPEGKEFPWYTKPFSEVIKGELLKGDTKVDSEEALSGKVKGFYFSAHWCPPCKMFTPELAKTYEKLQELGKNFEIVFVSNDRTEATFQEYYKTMPWLAIPFKDDRADKLNNLFDVEGIPKLIIVDENNEVITGNGRGVIEKDKECIHFPWYPQPVEEVGMENASNLNESACLILFTNGDKALQESAVELMSETAKAYKEAQKASVGSENELPSLFFYYEGSEEDSVSIATSVRSFANLEGDDPVLAIIDVPEERKCSVPAKNLTKEVVRQLVEDFKAGKLEFQPVFRS